MKQEALTYPNNDLSNISFQQKSTGLSLLIMSSATAYYFANMWPMRPIALENDIIPAEVIFNNLALGIVLGISLGAAIGALIANR